MTSTHTRVPRRSLLGMAVATPALAWQPSRAVRIIVPSAAGGSPDVIVRILADALRAALGQPVVVENRAGGAGTIGLLEVARAAPDGHVLGYGNVATLAINRALLASQPFDVERDFAPVSLLGFVPNALVVRPGLPAGSVADLVALLRRQPGRLTFASAGNGTTGHLSAEIFRSMTGTDMVHVPYRGSPQAIADLIAGQVDLAFDNVTSVAPHLREGRLRALATTGARRTALFPDVPTVAEAGVPGFAVTAWGGLVAPAATPPAALASLNQAVNEALASAAVRQRYAALAFEPVGGAREALWTLAASEAPAWAEAVRRSGARAE